MSSRKSNEGSRSVVSREAVDLRAETNLVTRTHSARLELQERIDSLVALFHGEGAPLALPRDSRSDRDPREVDTREQSEAEEDGSDADR